jgi:hypothetical protein
MESRRIVLFFVSEFILGVVFLSGIWIRFGIYPEEGFWQSILMNIYSLLPIPYFFWLMPFFMLFFSILGSYFIGGWLGLTAIGFAFLGGYFINNFFGIVLLVIGIVVGFFAPLRD